MLLCSFQGIVDGCQCVDMRLLGCCSWFPGHLYAGVRVVGRVGCLAVVRTLLGCCRWLPGCCYAVARML